MKNMDGRTLRGANTNSDNHLVRGKMYLESMQKINFFSISKVLRRLSHHTREVEFVFKSTEIAYAASGPGSPYTKTYRRLESKDEAYKIQYDTRSNREARMKTTKLG